MFATRRRTRQRSGAPIRWTSSRGLLDRFEHALHDQPALAEIEGRAFAPAGTKRDIARLAERILGYRVFPDAEDRMNLSVKDIAGELLLVPQFTLTADTRKGTRASFTKGADPEKAAAFFDRLVAICRDQLAAVECGRFGADMQVSLVNDGPITFWIES